MTTTSGNRKLDVTTSEESTTFRWTYTFNDIEAPDKCVALRYKNGTLKYFIDNWNIYKIGNTNFNISEQDAVEIALSSARNIVFLKTETENGIYELKFNVTNAMIWETIFVPSTYMDTPHSEDLFELYPMHHVWVSLDKFYPGNIYGFNVYVWADTGKLGFIKERVTTMDPPAELVATFDDAIIVSDIEFAVDESKPSSLPLMEAVLPAVAVIFLVAVPIYFSAKKKIVIHSNLPKLNFLKISSVTLCLFLSLAMVLVFPVSTVNATNYQGRATIWGAESTDARNTTIWSGGMQGSSWRKTNPEVWQQRETAQLIANYFANNGYSASNYQGEGSTKSSILANISYNEQHHSRVAVVDFDHGVGTGINGTGPIQGHENEFHYLFEDTIGTYNGTEYPGDGPHHEHAVYDYEIAEETGPGNTYFAFINTCLSADTSYGEGPNNETGNIQGMPYAWTHCYLDNSATPPPGYMSDNGYLRADNGNFCYLGFSGGSEALNQSVAYNPNGPPGYGPPYHEWIEHFFAFALTDDKTINNALDEASNAILYHDFDETLLYNNFTCFWPMYIEGDWQEEWNDWPYYSNGTLRVYGNGNLKLYQPLLTVNAYSSLGSPLVAGVTIDGVSVGSTSINKRVFATFPGETHTIHVAAPSGYTFQKFMVGANTYLSNPISISVESAKTVNAYFTQNPPPHGIVNVVVDSVPYDGYSRYHALTVDNQIPTVFWTGDWHDQYPGAIIATTYDTLHYETAFNLTQGYHTIEYAVSCYVGYWHVTLTVNVQIEAQQDSDVYDHVTAQIYVNP